MKKAAETATFLFGKSFPLFLGQGFGGIVLMSFFYQFTESLSKF